MRIQSKLCHIDDSRAIVMASAWNGNESLGTAFGQATTVEEAEDRAILRLERRININQSNLSKKEVESSSATSTTSEKRNNLLHNNKYPEVHMNQDLSKENLKKEELPLLHSDPIDWSEELATFDFEIKRIGWSREDETIFLTTSLGLTSRSKITKYNDLTSLIKLLKKVKNGSDINDYKLANSRKDLIKHCNYLLERLEWHPDQGRRFLEDSMKVPTLQTLNDNQLLHFNLLLEDQLESKKE